ncbi:MAG TPA: cyclic nucleotide-binding domain-containing protein [Gammaproteobacteria bacterium]|nr:cyclic nucleotide-binding domain-containing protein [Gammaproteobacteria bacterium]
MRESSESSELNTIMQPCPVCTLQPVCVPWGLEQDDLERLERIVEHPAAFASGSQLFRFGDPLRAIYVVRGGAFKNFRTDSWGRERVLGFSLAGELVGIDGIYPRRHVSHAVALQESLVCALPYAALAERMEQSEGLRRQIFRLVSRDTGQSFAMTRDTTADQRVARFLLDVSQRQQRQSRSATHLDLPMSRLDLGNYLRLSGEAVDRVFERFVARDLLVLGEGRVELLDLKNIISVAH